MSRLAHAQSYRDLIVYQKSRQLQREVFNMTKSFPKEEMFSLTDQIRRSSRSVGSNISEAWTKQKCSAAILLALCRKSLPSTSQNPKMKPLITDLC